MFHKKKFTLVDKKQRKDSAKSARWLKHVVIVMLVLFALLLILANIRSKSYYQNMKNVTEEKPQIRSILFRNTNLDCLIIGCTVTCYGPVTDVKTFLESKKHCNPLRVQIIDPEFSDNRIRSDWLEGSFNLSFIKITRGTFAIDDGAFDHKSVRYVQELEFNTVTLEHLSSNTFFGLSSLETFILINKVKIFSAERFLSPISKSLKKVQIKHITDVASDPGPWLYGAEYKELLTIVFNGSNFGGYIKAATFAHLKELLILMLNDCRIDYIEDGAFDFMMSHTVVYISLINNNLKHISGNYLSKVSSLVHVFIEKNPWNCTCDLEELLTNYQKNAQYFGNASCATPLEFAGRNLSEVSVEHCIPSQTTTKLSSTSQTLTSPITTTIQISNIPTDLTIGVSSTSSTVLSTEWSTADHNDLMSTSTSSTQTIISTPVSEPLDSTTILNTKRSTSDHTDVMTMSTSSTSLSISTSVSEPFDSTIDISSTTRFLTSSTDYATSSMTTSQKTIPLPQTTPSPTNIVSIECHRYSIDLFKTINKKNFCIDVSLPDTYFSLLPISATSVQLNIENPSEDLAVIWFYDQPRVNSSEVNIHMTREFKAGCQREVKDILVVQGLAQYKTYTFCLVKQGYDVISPFNCRSYCTSYSLNQGNSGVWLMSEDKALTIGLFCLGVIFSLCIGMGGMFTILRSYPALLKSSKRVIIVNSGKGDVLIMPKTGNKLLFNGSSFQNSLEKKSSTINQRRFSDTSNQSGLSYIMANNYESIGNRWKMNVYDDTIYANRVPRSPPPPLPKRISESTTISKDTADRVEESKLEGTLYDYEYIS